MAVILGVAEEVTEGVPVFEEVPVTVLVGVLVAELVSVLFDEADDETLWVCVVISESVALGVNVIDEMSDSEKLPVADTSPVNELAADGLGVSDAYHEKLPASL